MAAPRLPEDIFVTDALRSGLPPHIAAKICGHALLDTTMGYAAIYPEDVITHHRRSSPAAEPSDPAKNIASSMLLSGRSSWPISFSALCQAGPVGVARSWPGHSW